MPAGLRFTSITRSFKTEARSVAALAGVSGEIAPGKITGLVGPDGAGKTTLIRVLAGLLDADAGRVQSTGELAHPRMAYMPQKFGLYEDLTVQENMTLYADLHGLDPALRAQRFSELNRFTSLGPFANWLAGNLSGGMKQKLGLACTLIVAPDILLLDEPSVGVDPVSRRELWSMVRALQGSGIAVLWSTAYLDEADGCDHVILLYDGRVIDEGLPSVISGHVARRTWRVVLPTDQRAGRKRDLQRAAATLPNVVDAQIKGRNLRIVTDRDDVPPDVTRASMPGLRALKPEPTPPQFEDAYLAAMRKQDLINESQINRRPGIYSQDPGAITQAVHLALDLGDKPQDDGLSSRAARHTNQTLATPVIETKDLSRRFGNFTAVDRFSFAVSRGEIFGLLGPNGAGKSTTFKMLCGLVVPSSGEALVAGFDLATARADARSRIGYMAQKFAYIGHLTLAQNMEFAGGVYGLARAALTHRIAEVAAEFDLEAYLHQNCGELPLGIKQRMALACAVLHKPAILFLDEPTSGVDPVTRREFWARLNAMADDGTTILVTSHFLDEAEYCDRMAIIYHGRQIAAGSPDEIKSAHADGDNPTLEQAFIRLIDDHDRTNGVRSAA
ncbi:MAG: ATP-binding cassette domain-containing protein [Rhodospirillaceae bacterium]|nr:ATP-binding cassette domain-containing protein [Rhodospirillaceae bacterium]